MKEPDIFFERLYRQFLTSICDSKSIEIARTTEFWIKDGRRMFLGNIRVGRLQEQMKKLLVYF